MTDTPKPCPHMDFAAEVDVHRLLNRDDTVTGYMADVRIKCGQCGLPFEFLGLTPGVDTQGAKVSIDGLEARIALSPKGAQPNPLQRMAFNVRKFDG